MLTSRCVDPDKSTVGFSKMHVRRFALILGGIALLSCTKHVELPDLGPRLSQTAILELSPSLTGAKAEYTDNCGHLQEVDIGGTLQDVLLDAANRTFKSLVPAGSTIKPDVVVRVKLVQSSFRLRMDGVYDRAETELLLGGLVSYVDQAGNPLGEQDVLVTSKDRVRIQPVQKNCDYILDTFMQNAMGEFARQFSEGARSTLERTQVAVAQQHPSMPAPAVSMTPTVVPVSPARLPSSGRSALSFKATVLDENGNLIFEGGERVRIRVDLVNGGDQELHQVAATLTGTSFLLAQFPATTLTAGRLQPGQSRSLEFVATVPQSTRPQKADIQVAVADPAIDPPPPQLLSLSLHPTGANVDDVDQVPVAASGFKRPHTYLVSVGIGSYRDQQLSMRKYGASDAEMVASYFQSLGGLPSSNVRLLQDWKALRPDIDEALLDWLPAHAGREAVVIVYFAGLATVSPTGEVFLLPYDGSTTTTSRAYPLKDLEAALGRLKVKQTVLLFDGIVSRLGADTRGKGAAPQWSPTGGSAIHIIAANGVSRSIEDEKHRHGLFTYYLLRALRGESDTNRDGEVTLAETVSYLSQKVLWASKSQYGQEQRPVIFPPVKSSDPAGALVLSKLAALRAAEVPNPPQ